MRTVFRWHPSHRAISVWVIPWLYSHAVFSGSALRGAPWRFLGGGASSQQPQSAGLFSHRAGQALFPQSAQQGVPDWVQLGGAILHLSLIHISEPTRR